MAGVNYFPSSGHLWMPSQGQTVPSTLLTPSYDISPTQRHRHTHGGFVYIANCTTFGWGVYMPFRRQTQAQWWKKEFSHSHSCPKMKCTAFGGIGSSIPWHRQATLEYRRKIPSITRGIDYISLWSLRSCGTLRMCPLAQPLSPCNHWGSWSDVFIRSLTTSLILFFGQLVNMYT